MLNSTGEIFKYLGNDNGKCDISSEYRQSQHSKVFCPTQWNRLETKQNSKKLKNFIANKGKNGQV